MRTLLLALALLLAATPARAESLRPSPEELRPSIVQIQVPVFDATGRIFEARAGSGVVVSRSGAVLTSAHLIAPASGASGITVGDVARIVRRGADRSEECLAPISRARLAPELGLALLRCEHAGDGSLLTARAAWTPIALAPRDVARADGALYLVAWAGDLAALPLRVLSFAGRRGADGAVRGAGRSYLTADPPVPGTLAGGALLDADGRLVALATLPRLPARDEQLSIGAHASLFAPAARRLLAAARGSGPRPSRDAGARLTGKVLRASGTPATYHQVLVLAPGANPATLTTPAALERRTLTRGWVRPDGLWLAHLHVRRGATYPVVVLDGERRVHSVRHTVPSRGPVPDVVITLPR